jgi:hypothetical protein
VTNEDTSKPFESLESAHEYVGLLREVLDEAYVAILDEMAAAKQLAGVERRVDALRLVEHKLNLLRSHLLESLILLNDLRTLRRLLLSERGKRARSADSP